MDTLLRIVLSTTTLALTTAWAGGATFLFLPMTGAAMLVTLEVFLLTLPAWWIAATLVADEPDLRSFANAIRTGFREAHEAQLAIAPVVLLFMSRGYCETPRGDLRVVLAMFYVVLVGTLTLGAVRTRAALLDDEAPLGSRMLAAGWAAGVFVLATPGSINTFQHLVSPFVPWWMGPEAATWGP